MIDNPQNKLNQLSKSQAHKSDSYANSANSLDTQPGSIQGPKPTGNFKQVKPNTVQDDKGNSQTTPTGFRAKLQDKVSQVAQSKMQQATSTQYPEKKASPAQSTPTTEAPSSPTPQTPKAQMPNLARPSLATPKLNMPKIPKF